MTSPGAPTQDDATSSFVRAQDELAGLVERSLDLRRELARVESRRLETIHEAVEFAARHAESFVAAHGSASEQRELARRAVIAELAVAWRMSEYSMQRLASEAYTLCTALPVTLAALRAGDLDPAQARVIVHEVNGLDLPPDVLSTADHELAKLAGSKTPAELRRAAKRLFEERQLETVSERHARAYAERAVEFEPAHNGMAWLSLYLRAPEALSIRDRLRQAARSAASVAEEHRTCAQLEADFARDLLLNGMPRVGSESAGMPRVGSESAGMPRVGSESVGMPRVGSESAGMPRAGSESVGMLRVGSESAVGDPAIDVGETASHENPSHANPSHSGTELVAERSRADVTAALASGDLAAALASIRPTVHVTVPVLTLLGLSDAPADLDGYGPIDADTARRLAANAPSFTRLLTHPISGAVLDVDRGSYRPPADLRRWLQVRDVTCRFPGCARPAKNCELDHSADWVAEHGKTAHDNLAHLCSNHHHLKHETGWSLQHLPDGVIEWTSLTGAVHRTAPPGVLRAPVDRVTPVGAAAGAGAGAGAGHGCRVSRGDREQRPTPDPDLVALAAKLCAEGIDAAVGGEFLEPVRPKPRPPATYPLVPAF